MLVFKEGPVMVLAEDIRTALSDMDRAFASTCKMSGLVPEVFDGSGLPAAQAQKVYKRLSDGLAQLVEGRAEIVSTIAHLQVIQQKSNCAETDTGCLHPWFTGAEAATTVVDPVPQPVV